MNVSQFQCHQEQLEAAQEEFSDLWDYLVVAKLAALSVFAGRESSPREVAIAKHAAWTAFLAGRGIKAPE